MTVCMPSHGFKLWFLFYLHGGGSGLRLNDGPEVKLLPV